MQGTRPCASIYLKTMVQLTLYVQGPFGGLNPTKTKASVDRGGRSELAAAAGEEGGDGKELETTCTPVDTGVAGHVVAFHPLASQAAARRTQGYVRQPGEMSTRHRMRKARGKDACVT